MEQSPTGRATHSALGGTLNREARRQGAAADAKSHRAESLAGLSRQLILPHTQQDPKACPAPAAGSRARWLPVSPCRVRSASGCPAKGRVLRFLFPRIFLFLIPLPHADQLQEEGIHFLPASNKATPSAEVS